MPWQPLGPYPSCCCSPCASQSHRSTGRTPYGMRGTQTGRPGPVQDQTRPLLAAPAGMSSPCRGSRCVVTRQLSAPAPACHTPEAEGRRRAEMQAFRSTQEGLVTYSAHEKVPLLIAGSRQVKAGRNWHCYLAGLFCLSRSGYHVPSVAGCLAGCHSVHCFTARTAAPPNIRCCTALCSTHAPPADTGCDRIDAKCIFCHCLAGANCMRAHLQHRVPLQQPRDVVM